MFGMGRDEKLVQEAGTAQTPSGRVLVFPNIYQHAVNPFRLITSEKPGHRKILVFFLVDPTARIISTAQVPPQDIRWKDTGLEDKVNRDLPVANMIKGQGYQMTLEEAKEHRLELMKERTLAKDVINNTIFSRQFNLCEH